MKVLLLAGGWSPEREVSLKGGEQIAAALKERGHSVTLCDPAKDFERLMDMAREHDAAFINLHGAPGEDGLVQAILDRVNCPYQGAGPAGSFLALHKAAARQIFRDAGLNIPDGAQEICPAPIAPEETAKVQDAALRAHHALGLKGYSRADFILQDDGTLYILEVNTTPGMTSTSLVPREAAVKGMSFADLVERLLELALER